MAIGPRFAVKFRRRREGSTNYKRRLGLLKSNKPRLVVRRSNKYIQCQVVDYDRKGDKTLASASSSSLKKLGWKHGTKNLPAAYLTGYLAGVAAKKAKVNEAMLDHGLYTTTKGSRIYSALKGVLDAGLKVPHGEKIFPDEARIFGGHIDEKIKKEVETLKSKVKA